MRQASDALRRKVRDDSERHELQVSSFFRICKGSIHAVSLSMQRLEHEKEIAELKRHRYNACIGCMSPQEVDAIFQRCSGQAFGRTVRAAASRSSEERRGKLLQYFALIILFYTFVFNSILLHIPGVATDPTSAQGCRESSYKTLNWNKFCYYRLQYSIF